jgi:hypothetical protein
VAAARHHTRVHLLEGVGQYIGLTPGVPNQAKPAARPQHRGRLGGGDRKVEPVPGLRRSHPVEGATSSVPAFEGSKLYGDAVAAGDFRHSWTEFHPQHLGTALGHLP